MGGGGWIRLVIPEEEMSIQNGGHRSDSHRFSLSASHVHAHRHLSRATHVTHALARPLTHTHTHTDTRTQSYTLTVMWAIQYPSDHAKCTCVWGVTCCFVEEKGNGG